MSRIKSCGSSLNWRHQYACDFDHISDAQKQRLQRGGRDADRLRKKLRKLARARFKNPVHRARLQAWLAEKGYSLEAVPFPADRGPQPRISAAVAVEALVTVPGKPTLKAAPEAAASVRLPSIGFGISTIRTNLAGLWPNGVPPAGAFLMLGGEQADAEAFAKWIAEVGDWHSVYQAAGGSKDFDFFPVQTEKKNGRVARDGRFAYTTHTLPKWDTQAFEDSIAAGEVPKEDLLAIFAAHDEWCATEGVRYDSCGAARPLVHCGIDWHLSDGSFHGHPRKLKSLPAYYVRADGTVQPRSLAPKRGRHRKGEHWAGGERLGLVSTDGRLVLNTLGPALVSADAWREENLQAPLDFEDADKEMGKPWAFLDRAIARRMEGGYFKWADESKTQRVWVSDSGVTRGPDGKGVQIEPGDMMGSRHLRRLVRDYAARNPAFGRRRNALIEAARLKAARDQRELIELVAGDELAAKDIEIDRRNGTIADAVKRAEAAEQQIADHATRASNFEARIDILTGEISKSTMRAETAEKLAVENAARASKAEARLVAERVDPEFMEPLFELATAELERAQRGEVSVWRYLQKDLIAPGGWTFATAVAKQLSFAIAKGLPSAVKANARLVVANASLSVISSADILRRMINDPAAAFALAANKLGFTDARLDPEVVEAAKLMAKERGSAAARGPEKDDVLYRVKVGEQLLALNSAWEEKRKSMDRLKGKLAETATRHADEPNVIPFPEPVSRAGDTAVARD